MGVKIKMKMRIASAPSQRRAGSSWVISFSGAGCSRPVTKKIYAAQIYQPLQATAPSTNKTPNTP
mgnify:CR=1 FL=1